MEQGIDGYEDWYKKKRRIANTNLQRQKRARLATEKAAAAVEVEGLAQQAGTLSGQAQALNSYARQFQKVTASHSRSLAMFACSKLGGLSADAQRASIEKFLSHRLVQNMLPPYLSDLSTVKYNHEVVVNIKNGMSSHCVGARKSKIVVAKDIVCTLASSQSVGSSRALARVLGVDRRNIKKGIERRLLLDAHEDTFWINYKRSTRSTAITTETRELIIEWWTTESTISPNRKDIVRNRIGVKTYEEHATHYLQVSQLEFFSAFKVKYPDKLIGITTFVNLKPWFIRRLREWNTCCCRYHQELRELLHGLNDLRTSNKGVHGKDGSCECRCECRCEGVCAIPVHTCAPPPESATPASRCQSELLQYCGVTELWQSLMCPKSPLSPWYKRECLMGDCAICGVKKLILCPSEINSDEIIAWKSISYIVVGKNEEGQDKKAPSIQYNETPARDLISYLKPKLTEFIVHNFIAQWQDCKFKEILADFPKDSILSCIDFSENYSMMTQNEIQSMHWRKVQVTILVHLSYRWNPRFDPNLPECGPKIIKELHYYVSDDNNHDTLYVQHCLMLHWKHVQSQGFLPRQHIVWSDGCSGQFKSSRAWHFVTKYPGLTRTTDFPKGCEMVWNFYATGHGKGEVDGAGALLKREVRDEQLKPQGQKVQDASDMVQYMRSESNKWHAAHKNIRVHTNNFFHEIGKLDVDRSKLYGVQTVTGSRSMHQVRSKLATDSSQCEYRQLSCFCNACMDPETTLPCTSKDHVPQWTLTRLRITKPPPRPTTRSQDLFSRSDPEVPAEVYEDRILPGHNVAVPTDLDDEPFWLLLVDKAAHSVESGFTDHYGNTWKAGTIVLRGLYYERLQPGSRTYILHNGSPHAFVLANSTLHSKFQMPPPVHCIRGRHATYELKETTLERIVAALESRALLE